MKRLVLEISLKPFYSVDDDYITKKVIELFDLWDYAIKEAKTLDIMFWVADGSEILVWNNDFNAEISWSKYVGFANKEQFEVQSISPLVAKPYRENPATITYGILKNIIAIFKNIAMDRYNVSLQAGATFDNGPEFAYSDFKYKWHPEITEAHLEKSSITSSVLYKVLCPWANLNGDERSYATYPNGIPDKTPLGEFFGKQAKSYMEAMGFDYIWFSNGFGFSYYPVTYMGANLTPNGFHNVDASEISQKVMSFWRSFKKECPFRIEVRGSNFSVGMDTARDYTPLNLLYDENIIPTPPPNSPWGYLDYNFGLEIIGYLSRISKTPGDSFPYRFYLDDPWFWQRCWTQGYERNAHDLYMPLSVNRINADGTITSPDTIQIITVDNEKGEFDKQATLEFIPHLVRGLKELPDDIGIVTLLYPFSEYHNFDSYEPSVSYFNDWYLANALNAGMPINSIINTENFREIIKSNIKLDTIIIAPTSPYSEEYYTMLCEYAKNGGKIIFYGPIQNNQLANLFDICFESPIKGDLLLKDKNAEKATIHNDVISGGGICEIAKEPLYTISDGKNERAYAVVKDNIAWVRGGLEFSLVENQTLPSKVENSFDTSIILVEMLSKMGYSISQIQDDENDRRALTFVHKYDNAIFFTGYKFDTTSYHKLKFPIGAPLLIGRTADIKDGYAYYSFEKAFRYECRVFVVQKENGKINCKRASFMNPTYVKAKDVCLEVSGLKNADLIIYAPVEAIQKGLVEVLRRHEYDNLVTAYHNSYVEVKNISGVVEISW